MERWIGYAGCYRKTNVGFYLDLIKPIREAHSVLNLQVLVLVALLGVQKVVIVVFGYIEDIRYYVVLLPALWITRIFSSLYFVLVVHFCYPCSPLSILR